MTKPRGPVPDVGGPPDTTGAVVRRLRSVAAARAEEALAELPVIARRFRTLLLVLTISIPLFLVGMVAILWHLAS